MPSKSWLRQATDEDLLAEIDSDLNDAMGYLSIANERQNAGDMILCFGPLEEAVDELQEAMRRLGRVQKRIAQVQRVLASIEGGIGPRTPLRHDMKRKITRLRAVLQGLKP